VKFEWNPDKNRENLQKHGVSFLTAARVFEQPILRIVDNRKDYGETRYIAIGAFRDTVYYVAYTVRNDRTRIISARRANRRERRKYREVYE